MKTKEKRTSGYQYNFSKYSHGHAHSKKHQGGAWKVAYADFITAMMALFMLLWLLNSTPSNKLKKIAEYFKPGFYGNDEKENKTGKLENEKAIDNKVEKNFDNPSDKEHIGISSNLESLREDIKQSLGADDKEYSANNSVTFVKMPNGLAIYMSDSGNSTIFEKGEAKLTSFGSYLLTNIAKKIRYTNMYVCIDGFSGKSIDLSLNDYGKWELSFDRANNVRKFLINNGLSIDNFYRISGYGDNDPEKDNDSSLSPNQKKIGIILIGRDTVNKKKTFNPNDQL
ncbi:flagellar motor protein MotB [Lyticum sinuosum]|uniref:Motility protein B n=1 Tax=Lyticum sinuosum TaxID=1332059 RepID=A0AAE4VL02_9RICK|nr:flagellar motor protein MotB [Lyticum sinuosum]MDZ5761279.1 Motility protein B [Lyticum sinuosum]